MNILYEHFRLTYLTIQLFCVCLSVLDKNLLLPWEAHEVMKYKVMKYGFMKYDVMKYDVMKYDVSIYHASCIEWRCQTTFDGRWPLTENNLNIEDDIKTTLTNEDNFQNGDM